MTIIENKSLALISLISTILTIGACTPQSSVIQNDPAQAITLSSPEKTLVLADISNNPQKKIRKFQPLADYLAANLADYDRGKVKIAPDLETMIAWLQSGEVDLYIDSPYPAMLAVDGANAKPILRRWKKGHAEYHSLIFTMSDRNIKSLADLGGKIVAFDHPASTTGYMLPLAKLQAAGLNPQEKGSSTATVSKDAVGYVFTKEDENSIEWLLSEKVAAAAINNLTFAKISPEIKEKVFILAATEKIARNFLLANAEMSTDEIKAISSILIDMEQTEDGRAVLEKFSQTSKFDKFPTQASLDKIKVLYQHTQNP